jgi:hypothetical protein
MEWFGIEMFFDGFSLHSLTQGVSAKRRRWSTLRPRRPRFSLSVGSTIRVPDMGKHVALPEVTQHAIVPRPILGDLNAFAAELLISGILWLVGQSDVFLGQN